MMNMTTILKSAYERIPKGFKYAFSPLFIRLMVNNSEFKKTWNELEKFENLTEIEKEKEQFAGLKDTLEYAYKYVPYYRDTFDSIGFDPSTMQTIDEIKRLPLLEKDKAVQLGDLLYSQENSLKYYKTFTGGSSGQALTVLLDKQSIYRERAVVTHYLSKMGYDPLKSKTVAFWGHNKDRDYYYSPLKNEIVISPFRLYKEDQFDSVCKDIEKFGATFVMGYPSAIYLFARMIEAAGRKVHFEHVVYYAENCASDEKAYIERVLECPVDSYYGHTERACFSVITESGCQFNDYYGYTELIPTENDGEYRIVCTGFLSRKMPLIRYVTDDVVKQSEDGKMQLVGHKRSEVNLISKNGQKIFKGAMTLHIEELKKIKRYQYVQNEAGKAELQIVVMKDLSEKEIENIELYIKRRCEGLLDVTVKFVDEVQLTSRGKFNWAVSNIGEGKIINMQNESIKPPTINGGGYIVNR